MTRFPLAALFALGLGVVGPATQASAQFAAQSVQFFHTSDVDGDERLTFGEFRTFIQHMAAAGAPVSQRIERLAAYRIAFGRVDANRDGLATPDELRAAERAR